VNAYRNGNKTDRTDSKSLLEASRNEEIRPVPIKSVAQQTRRSANWRNGSPTAVQCNDRRDGTTGPTGAGTSR
jgi:hypothetical protein